jgi:hypothetical protein
MSHPLKHVPPTPKPQPKVGLKMYLHHKVLGGVHWWVVSIDDLTQPHVPCLHLRAYHTEEEARTEVARLRKLIPGFKHKEDK